MWCEKVNFTSGAGNRLSGMLQYPLCSSSRKVLILGPHPLLGGDMHNNVIQAIMKACATNELIALCFDYHGTGESTAQIADGTHILDYYQQLEDDKDVTPFYEDAQAAYEYLQADNLTVIGYSFGSYLALRYFQKRASQLLVISPPLDRYDCLGDIRKDTQCLLAEDDFLDNTTARAVFDRVTSISCGHFFRNKEDEVYDWVCQRLGNTTQVPLHG